MPMRGSISSFMLIAVPCASGALALDETKYPDWKGQWVRADGAEAAPWAARGTRGLGQQPPLIPEYQALFEANLKQFAGVKASDPTTRSAMPRVMMAIHPMEIVVMPDTTYIMIETSSTLRRIFTDGRAWPKERRPSYAGYSIGQWEDSDRDGRFDTLAVETRWTKGPHSYDDNDIPLHQDEQAVVRERISLDRSDPHLLRNEVTTIDNALSRPWTVTQSYRRVVGAQPIWTERICSEDSKTIRIGEEDYALGRDGLLMPVRKGQPPPDLRYFDQTRN